MRSGLIWLCLVAGLAVVFGHAGHDHEHDSEDPQRSCDTPTRSHDVMKEDQQYYKQYMREKKRFDIYKRQMKAHKDHQFRSQSLMENEALLGDRTKDVIKSKHDKNLQNLRKSRSNHKEKRQLYDDYEDGIDDEKVIRIPVVFHVMYSNDDENLGVRQLDSQIDVLNKDFRANNAEIKDGEVDSIWTSRVGDSKIEFYRAHVERVSIAGKSSDFCEDESNFKLSENGGSDQWDPATYLNFWTCDLSSEGLLGYAYFPCLLGTSSEWKDGVVVTSGAVGSSEDDDGTFYFSTYTYDMGRTATHEIGHYLAMEHVWGYYDSCSTSDTDGIDDTPLQKGPNYGCPTNDPDSCDEVDEEAGEDLPDMTINFMDYVNDACMYVFTEEQAWGMRSVMKGCRIQMYNNGVTNSTGATAQPQSTQDLNFQCDDGCDLPNDYINDGYCDCQTCEDEQYWTCDNCTASVGCPSDCGDWTYCDALDNSSYYFECDNGCHILAEYIDDYWCDCSDCEDETDYTCDSCIQGCPSGCGNYTYCPSFECDDGCEIFDFWEDDGWCDCTECEDETDWTCDTCSDTYDCSDIGECSITEVTGINCSNYSPDYTTSSMAANISMQTTSDLGSKDGAMKQSIFFAVIAICGMLFLMNKQ